MRNILDIAFYSEPKLQSIDQLLSKHRGTWEHYLLMPNDIAVYLIKFADFEAKEQRGNLHIIVLPMPALFTTGKFIRQLKVDLSPQLIITHSLKFVLRHYLMQKQVNRGCKIALQLHADWLRRNPIVQTSQRMAYKSVDYFLITGAAQIEPMLEKKVLPKKAEIIELMEGSNNFVPKKSSNTDQKLKLIWVARFIARKDFGTMLKACQLLKKKQVDFSLDIISSGGPLFNACLQMLKDLDLENETTLVCNLSQDKMQAKYQAADFFVSTSWLEGSGWALCEAMACGTAAVVTDIPPHRWMTDVGRAGGLFSCGNAEELAGILEQSSSKKNELGKLAREIFEKKLSFQAIADTIAGLL